MALVQAPSSTFQNFIVYISAFVEELFLEFLVLLETDRILAVMLFASLIQLGRSKSAVAAKVKAE